METEATNGSGARPEKVAVVDEVRERLDGSSAVLVTEYRGLTVAQMSNLRRELRPAGGYYRVYKNTLARRAANEAGIDLDELLVGPTALAFVEQTPEGEPGDVIRVAKTLRDFARANPDLIVKGGVFEGTVMDASAVTRLADIEPREVLLAKLAGLIAAPMQQFASLLEALPRNFAYGLKALIEQQGGTYESAPETDEQAADEQAAEEPAADVTATEEVHSTENIEIETPAETGEGEES
jgi:large subunit ribosomal protein L10